MRICSPKKRIFALLTAPFILFNASAFAVDIQGMDGAAFYAHTTESVPVIDEVYLSDTVFFGESTTAHLSRSGGILDTPLLRRCVWRDQSGTRMLDRRILTSLVDYTDREGVTRSLSFEEALLCERPSRLVLSFGLNGILFFQKNTDAFLRDYERLILRIQELSPETHILIQSVYPVRRAESFGCDAATLNSYITALNKCLRDFSKTTDGVSFLDTASVLRDESGYLKKNYDAGDGIHLSNDAYREILRFLCLDENRI